MNLDLTTILLISLIPLIAFLYASVGHGGASGYLALMSLMGIAQEVMKPTALVLNMIVSAIAFWYFWRAGYFRFRLFLYFALGSVPLSFLGGMIDVDPRLYKLILGLFLLIATLKLTGIFNRFSQNTTVPLENRRPNTALAVVIGAAIGFFSGLIGIGGGIILSPVLLLLKWSDVKEAAAISALFIWVNSVSGFLGQVTTGIHLPQESILFIALAVCGGLAGSYFGTYKFNTVLLRKILAGVLVFAAIKLLTI
ncbi:MAG: sulfite exporter TauE/SafE family protein [Bacteroidetes bacterium]|nr:sulfite exporter TauE/SafE family protein [Bacteroidota bacterium]